MARPRSRRKLFQRLGVVAAVIGALCQVAAAVIAIPMRAGAAESGADMVICHGGSAAIKTQAGGHFAGSPNCPICHAAFHPALLPPLPALRLRPPREILLGTLVVPALFRSGRAVAEAAPPRGPPSV